MKITHIAAADKRARAKQRIQAATTASMLEAFEAKLDELSFNSSTDIEAASDPRRVIIDDDDYDTYYSDPQGEFGVTDGAGGEEYSFAEIKDYWNRHKDDDPVLEEYDSFDSWWNDTKDSMDQIAACINASQQQIQADYDFRQVDIYGEDYHEKYEDIEGNYGGEPGRIYSLAEIKDYWNENNQGDPCLAAYRDFESWWRDTRSLCFAEYHW